MSGREVTKLCWYLLAYPRTTYALHLYSTYKESLTQLLFYASQYASQYKVPWDTVDSPLSRHAKQLLLQFSAQGQSSYPVDQVVSRLDSSGTQHTSCARVLLCNTLKFRHKYRRGRYYLVHLREQRLSALPSPTVQGLSRQLAVQVLVHLDISGSCHNLRQRMSPCNMLNIRYHSKREDMH